jgi:PAS domain S-box-containing protein
MSDRKAKILCEDVPLAYQSLDKEGHIRAINNSWLSATGYARKEVVGARFQTFLSSRSSVLFETIFPALNVEGVIHGVELEMTRRNGTVFVVSLDGTVVRDDDGNIRQIHCFLADVTLRKDAEAELRRSREALRNLSRRLQSIREEERARMSRDIHDEVGQMLAVLHMEVSLLARKIPRVQFLLARDMEDVRKQIIAVIEKVRKIAADSRPRILDDLGLTSAVEWQVEEFERRTGIKCKLTLHSPQNLIVDKERSTALFRILQEALTNVLRHAEADRVSVYLGRQNGRLTLIVRDNGKGIGKDKLSDPFSSGIVGMRERLHPWGGRVTLVGRKDKGTKVSASLPLTGDGGEHD